MLVTNLLSLPEPIVRAVQNDGYSKGTARLSVTELIGPPRLVALSRKHWHELEEDAADRIFSLIGQAVHEILRRADLEALTEQRLSVEVLGWEVSGQFDRLAFTPAGLLQDYKVSSVWAVRDGAKEEWVQQVNLYAHLLRSHGFTVDQAQIVVLLRDWRLTEAKKGGDYPPQQVVVLDVPLWPEIEAELFLQTRVRLHQSAEETLPLCTPEERWSRPSTWAVTKPGRQKAMRVLDTEVDAIAYANGMPGAVVEHRPGEAIRCAYYCPVASFCRAVGDAQFANEEGA